MLPTSLLAMSLVGRSCPPETCKQHRCVCRQSNDHRCMCGCWCTGTICRCQAT